MRRLSPMAGIAALVGFLVLVVVGAASLFVVPETQQVLITQFGEPIRVISKPGLHAKLPFVQNAIYFDRRLLDYEAPGEEVILGDQRRLIVDSFTRYHITDPLQFYRATGAAEIGIRGRLSSIVSSSLRRVLGGQTLIAVLSADRARIMGQIREQVESEAKRFGITIEDVRLRRADLPEENTQAILSRMQSERERVAREQRAEGAETAARIRAAADRDRTVILAEARGQSEVLRGQGEQESIRIFAAAFQRDPQFFTFWRTLQAYRVAFNQGDARLVLTPNSDFLRLFRDGPGDVGTATASGVPASGITIPGAANHAAPAAPAAPASGSAPAAR